MRSARLWVGLGICGLIVCAIVFAQSIHSRKSEVATPSIQVRSSTLPEASVSITSAPMPLPNYYASHISANMFARPTPAPPAPLPAAPPPPAPIPPPPPDPLDNYVYTGTVTVGEMRYALIENSKLKSGQFVKLGDAFIGGRVTNIDPMDVTLWLDGTARTLAKSTVINLTPLDRSAAFLGGSQNGAAGPGGNPNSVGLPESGGMAAAVEAQVQAQMMSAQGEVMRTLMNKIQSNGGDLQLDFKLIR